jgi:hypothetical protein
LSTEAEIARAANDDDVVAMSGHAAAFSAGLLVHY